jgi:hypothetical protein
MSICQNFATDCQSRGNRGNIGDDDGTLSCSLVEVAATGVAAHVVEDAPKSFALEVRAIGIGHKVEVHLRLFEEYLLDAELFAADAQGNNADEFFGNVWNGTKSVSKAATIGVEVVVKVLAGSEVVEFAIEQHALGVAGDVEVGEVHLKVGLEGAVIDVIRGRRKEEGGRRYVCRRISP